MDSLNDFQELTIQKRVQDVWYHSVLEECRYGRLTDEFYNFLLGCPTANVGSWMADGSIACGTARCHTLAQEWAAMAEAQRSWAEMKELECSACQKERERRARLIETKDPRLHSDAFLTAVYLHKNNEPKYHAMLLRASEQAKRLCEYVL